MARMAVWEYPSLGYCLQSKYHPGVSRTKFTLADDRFRELLKASRLKAGLTQSELAKRLDAPQSYVSKFETGERRLDFVETALVCGALGIGIVSFAREFAKRFELQATVKRVSR